MRLPGTAPTNSRSNLPLLQHTSLLTHHHNYYIYHYVRHRPPELHRQGHGCLEGTSDIPHHRRPFCTMLTRAAASCSPTLRSPRRSTSATSSRANPTPPRRRWSHRARSRRRSRSATRSAPTQTRIRYAWLHFNHRRCDADWNLLAIARPEGKERHGARRQQR